MRRLLASTRREILAGGIAAALLPTVKSSDAAAATEGTCALGESSEPRVSEPDIAVSLREMLKGAKSGGPKQFATMTRLEACVGDDEGQDIILLGRNEKGWPALHIDDLIVAVRAAQGKYGRQMSPAISIDPDNGVMNALRDIDLGHPSARQKYAAVCAGPQTVRVEGMPRNTRVAKILVEADYRMKQVGQGLVTLPVSPSFSGTFAPRLALQRERLRSGQDLDEMRYSRRYWFQARQFDYEASSGAMILQHAKVELREEDDTAGATEATRKSDPVSKAFACAWTARMEEIYRAEPIWREMHNVYRHFAAGKIMVEERMLSGSAYEEVGALIDAHNVDDVSLPATLPGLSRFEVIESGRKRFASTVCGGVSLGFTGRVLSKLSTPYGRSWVTGSVLKRAAIASRPDKSSKNWSISQAAYAAAGEWHRTMTIEMDAKSEQYRVERERQQVFEDRVGYAIIAGLVTVVAGIVWGLWRLLTPSPLAKLLPGANETQMAVCAALCGAMRDPQQPGGDETQHIESLLTQVQFPLTAERIHAVAKVVAAAKGGLLGVLRGLSNKIDPDARGNVVAGAFLVMRTGGREADMEKVYAIGKAVFLEPDKVDAMIAPYNRQQPVGAVQQSVQVSYGTWTATSTPAARSVVRRGTINDRDYRIFSDGTVEYDSIIGLKVFPNETELRAFVS